MDIGWEEHGWERLGPGVGRRRLPGWDATAGLVAGATGALLYDTGSSVREGTALRADAEALLGAGADTGRDAGGDAGREPVGAARDAPAGPPGSRVSHLALSHAHFDHVLGASAFPGAAVYGAVGLAEALAGGAGGALYEEAVRHGLSPSEAAGAVEALVRPSHPVSGTLTLDLGGRQVTLANVGPGHTPHDLALLVPGSPPVLFCGDLVEESGEPQAGPDALPGRWPAALDRLLALGGEEAVYVPGHGAAVDAAFVRAQRDALAARFGES